MLIIFYYLKEIEKHKYGISLFHPIHKNRKCKSAGIEDNFCGCR